MTRPNPHIALIYHYDLARALAGEIVDWQAIPVNVDAGREGGDLCRAAADFAKRRDLFAMPAPKIPVPVIPATVEQEVADPEPIGLVPVPGSAANHVDDARRIRLRARIIDLVDSYSEADRWLRHHWPEGVPTLKHDGHTDDQLAQILAAIRRVEAEVGAGWHPDDGGNSVVASPPVGVEASTTGPAATHDEGGLVTLSAAERLRAEFNTLPTGAATLCKQIAGEAHAAGRSLSLQAVPTLRRWSIARAVIAWAASGKPVDDMWCHAALLATFEQCADADATLGGLISQFTIEQADRLYDAAHAAK